MTLTLHSCVTKKKTMKLFNLTTSLSQKTGRSAFYSHPFGLILSLSLDRALLGRP